MYLGSIEAIYVHHSSYHRRHYAQYGLTVVLLIIELTQPSSGPTIDPCYIVFIGLRVRML